MVDVESPSLSVFLPNLHGGGAERMIVNLANGVAERGRRISFIVGAAEGPYLSEIDERVELVDLGSRRIFGAVLPLARYLRRHRPQALLVTLNHASIIALTAKRLARVETRVVVREANTFSLHGGGSFRGRVIKALMRLLYPCADAVVAVSEGVADDLSRATRVRREDITVLPNPVVTKDLFFKARAPVDHPWLSGTNTKPVILAVGSLSRQKDHATLIEAFALIAKKTEARLIILGEGPLRDELDNLVSDLGVDDRVSMPGFVENPFAYMARASLFVLPSRYEGMPGVLIQAMACGCRVVSTDCPSGPRELLEDGKYGRLVPVGNSVALSHTIVEMIARPFPDSSDVKERVDTFSVDKSVNRYLETLYVR